MSFDTAFTRIETELERLGNEKYTYRVDLNSLSEATGRGNISKSYLLRLEEGPYMYREASLDPVYWSAILELELGYEIKNREDRNVGCRNLALRYQKFLKSVQFVKHPELCNLVEQSRALTDTRDGQVLILTARFEITYFEEVDIS